MSQSFLSRDEFRRTIWRVVLPGLLLLVAQAAILTLLVFYWHSSSERVQHSERVISSASNVERLLVNMETGARGFWLTNDPQFIEPYEQARVQIAPAIAELISKVADNPAQVDRLDRIRTIVGKWQLLPEELTAFGITMPPGKAQIDLLLRRKAYMDEIRLRISEIIDAESALRSQRITRESRDAGIAVVAGVVVTVLIGVTLAWINRRTVAGLVSTYQRAIDAQSSANRQFSDLAEAIPQLVWIADADGKSVYFNKPWSEWTGRSSEDLKANDWFASVKDDQFTAVSNCWKESIGSGSLFEGEYRLKHGADGTYRWFLCRAMPVVDQSGTRVRWFGTCTDIDNQKLSETQKEVTLAAERAAHSELLRASKIKDEFLATLSHELRTPMSAIIGWSRLLKDPAVRAKSLDQALEAIHNNARAQARLIDDLLDMSRIISGKLTLKTELVDLTRTIELAVESVRPAASNKQITLDVRVPAERSFDIAGDPARLQQVVWNLLTNAVKFTPKGGSISIELLKTESNAKIIVTDTGQGIQPRFIPFVFDRFRQADASITRLQGGLGLGLAIVKNLVELHGGTVLAESEGTGRGSTFTVAIPLSRELLRIAHDQDSLIAQQGGHNAAMKGRRVLVVDDDPDTAQVIAATLEHFGLEPRVANSGKQAMEVLIAEPFDLLISDLGMPEMDGYTLIRAIRTAERSENRPRIHAIALSAFARREDRAQTAEAGFDVHIAKPASPDELTQAITSLLG